MKLCEDVYVWYLWVECMGICVLSFTYWYAVCVWRHCPRVSAHSCVSVCILLCIRDGMTVCVLICVSFCGPVVLYKTGYVD